MMGGDRDERGRPAESVHRESTVIKERGTDSLTQPAKKLPPVLGRLFTGTLWLSIRVPLQMLFSLWQVPLIFQALGPKMAGADYFAWGFGFFQMLFEFGMSSALQRSVTERWARGDRDGVDRAIACGMNFYAVMAFVQATALLLMAYVALPYSAYGRSPVFSEFIVKLLWLQALTAPVYGLSAVLSSVLQASRRYDFMPRLELAIVTIRFAILWFGVMHGFDFFHIVVAQTFSQIALAVTPPLWVMIRELGHRPHFQGARWEDFQGLIQISTYMFLVQLSVVLADRLDTTVLGYATDDEEANAVYAVISRPFTTIRQTGWTLAYMVMPAVASLAAARDKRGLDRVIYDGTRLHVALILPLTLLAAVYAAPFLTLWNGDNLGYDAARRPLAPPVPRRHDSAGAVGSRASGLRHEQGQSHRLGGDRRRDREPSAQLRPHPPLGRLRRDLGHRAHHLILQLVDPRRLRLPRIEHRPPHVPPPHPERAGLRRGGAVARGVRDDHLLPLTSEPQERHVAPPLAPLGLAPRGLLPRLHRWLSRFPRRPRRFHRTFRQVSGQTPRLESMSVV